MTQTQIRPHIVDYTNGDYDQYVDQYTDPRSNTVIMNGDLNGSLTMTDTTYGNQVGAYDPIDHYDIMWRTRFNNK